MDPERDPEGIEVEYLNKTGAIDGRRLLEIGCGNGRLAWRYASFAAAIVGVDPDYERLVETLVDCPEELSTPLLFGQAAAENLPFADEAFESALFGWSL